jgi:membrane fusion protein (multidrug efflux system)
MRVSRVQALILLLISFFLSACNASREKPHDEANKITVTTVQTKTATIMQQYTCRIDARRHIDVRTPAEGYLAAIPVREGQTVKEGDLLFQVGPPPDKEKPEPENQNKLVSIKSPFDGTVGRFPRQQGSFVLKGETLTTLSDNTGVWVYFEVPEKHYLESMAEQTHNMGYPDVELMLANHSKFPQTGKIREILGGSSTTGNIVFRADFPNPDGLLRHGQTGTLLIKRVVKDAILLIPRRATFEGPYLWKRYVYVVDKDDVAHQREISIQNEVNDVFVVEKGVGVGDKIVSDGVRMVRDGDKVKY